MRKRSASRFIINLSASSEFLCIPERGNGELKLGKYANLGHDGSWTRSGNYYMQKGLDISRKYAKMDSRNGLLVSAEDYAEALRAHQPVLGDKESPAPEG